MPTKTIHLINSFVLSKRRQPKLTYLDTLSVFPKYVHTLFCGDFEKHIGKPFRDSCAMPEWCLRCVSVRYDTVDSGHYAEPCLCRTIMRHNVASEKRETTQFYEVLSSCQYLLRVFSLVYSCFYIYVYAQNKLLTQLGSVDSESRRHELDQIHESITRDQLLSDDELSLKTKTIR